MKNLFYIITSICAIIALMTILAMIIYYFISSYKTRKQYKTPYVNTFNKDLILFLKRIDLSPETKLCDLGCGDGKRLRTICKAYNIKDASGYDINHFAILRGKLKNKLKKQTYIQLHHQDIFSVNLKNYNTIYLYLFPHMMENLEKHIQKKANTGTKIIVNTFPFPSWEPHTTIRNQNGKKRLFIYTVN